MGSVFLGVMPGTGKPCAVKLVRAVANERHKARLRREAQLSSKVRHPHLIEVYDVGFVGDLPWLAMEYVDGTHLGRLIKRGDERLKDPSWVRMLFLGVAEALAALHDHGILHRDMKPGNIMVDSQDRAILMDLGLAVNDEASRLTKTGHLVGTLTYLAPELFAGRPASEASDWYALGVALYKVLEGRTPYTSEEVLGMLKARRWKGPPPLQGPLRGHQLARIAERLMEKDPKRRLADLGALRVALGQTDSRVRSPTIELSSRGVKDPPVTRPRRARLRGPASVLAVLVAALVGGLALANLAPVGAPPAPAAPVIPLAVPPEPAPPEPARPARLPPEGEGAAAWKYWAADRVKLARAQARRVDAVRVLRHALASLRLASGEPTDLARARLGVMRDLLEDPSDGKVSRVWLDRSRGVLTHLEEELGSRGLPADLDGWARRLDKFAARDPAPGLAGDPFPPRPPPTAALWAIRDRGPADLPTATAEELVGLGYGLPEDFDFEDWAGDLVTRPLALLARARHHRAFERILKDPELAHALEESRHWEPPLQKGGIAFKFWFEHQYLAAVQAHFYATSQAEYAPLPERRRELARAVEDAELSPALRGVLRAWVALFEAFWEHGVGRRKAGPLERERAALIELFDELSGTDGGPLHSLLAFEAGYLLLRFDDILLDCDALERRVHRVRARLPWDSLDALGVGRLLARVTHLELDAAGDSTLAGICRATAIGARLDPTRKMIEFLDR